MATPTLSLASVLQTRYAVTEETADALTIEWAATFLAETVGADAAAKAWKRLNAKRYRAGRYTDIPRYGTPLYAAYFA